jgi:hypothetical protein
VLVAAFLKRYLIVVPNTGTPIFTYTTCSRSISSIFSNMGRDSYYRWFIDSGNNDNYTLLSKLFPVIPIWEVAHDMEKKAEKQKIENE